MKTPREVQKVNVDFPVDLLRRIDAQAARLGVSRQAYIKIRIGDAIDQVERSSARAAKWPRGGSASSAGS